MMFERRLATEESASPTSGRAESRRGSTAADTDGIYPPFYKLFMPFFTNSFRLQKHAPPPHPPVDERVPAAVLQEHAARARSGSKLRNPEKVQLSSMTKKTLKRKKLMRTHRTPRKMTVISKMMKRKRVILRIRGVQGLRRHGRGEAQGQGREGRGDDVEIPCLCCNNDRDTSKGVRRRFLGVCTDIFTICNGAPVISQYILK